MLSGLQAFLYAMGLVGTIVSARLMVTALRKAEGTGVEYEILKRIRRIEAELGIAKGPRLPPA